MDTQVIISYNDWQRLKQVELEFKKAFDLKKIIIHHNALFLGGPTGRVVHNYSIVNETELVNDLNNLLAEKQKTINELQNQLIQQKAVPKKTKWRF